MDYISTTDLRKKALKLRESLEAGNSTYLVHRSKVLGKITPFEPEGKLFDSADFAAKISKLPKSQYTTYTELKKSYKQHLRKKYVKDLP